MRNMPVLIIFTLIWVMSAPIQAHALFLQGSNELYSPYPPVLSRPVNILPEGFVSITVGDENYYYYNGIFYQKVIREQKYVMVPPPIGAVVFNIPQGYQLMLLDGISYYEYQGVFYKRVLEGYRVTYPPV